MPNLKLKFEQQEQRGPDTFLKIKASESVEDGGANTMVGITLHDVQSSRIKMEQGGVLFRNHDGAPCILKIGTPISAPLL